MKNRLHDYFEAARRVESLVTVDDVKKLTNSGLRSKKHLNLTHKIMIGTGLITLLSVLFYTQRPVEQPVIKTDRAQKTHVTPQITNEEKHQQVKASESAVYPPKQSSAIIPEKKKIIYSKVDHRKQDITFYTPSPVAAPAFGETNADEYFDETGRLVLSYEELAALGIITNGNVLEYATVTDSAKTYVWDGTSITSWPFYRLSVEEHGSRRVDNASTTDSLIIHNSKPFWAAAVTYGDDKSSLNVTDNIYGVGYDRLYFNGLRPLLVPVSVNLKAKPGRWSHDLSIVFWFKPTASFYDALPRAASNACIKRFGTKNEMQFRDSLAYYRAQVKEHGRTKGFDAATVASLKKNYLRLPKAQLKAWDIYPRKDGFYYSGLIKKADGVYWLRIKEKKHYTGITTSRFLKFKKPSTYIPVALTDTLITMVHYLSISDSGQDQNKDSLLADFKEHAHQMTPVLADSGTIIWFREEHTDRAEATSLAEKGQEPVAQKIQTRERFSSTHVLSLNEVQEQQKRYVFAKPEQYRSLGIYVDEKELTYQNWFMHEGKVLDQFVSRKNNGAVFLGMKDAPGALRPYDNPFQLAAITGFNMDSAFFFGTDSFGIQSGERAAHFRKHIDQLVPVVITQNGSQIVCWFTDHANLKYLVGEPGLSSANTKLKRPASYELTAEKATEIGLIRIIDGKIVIPVEGDEQISYVATSLSVDNTAQSLEWLGFRSGPLVTFSKRYQASPYKKDTMEVLFGNVRFTPLFVTETDGHFGFVKFEKRSGQARVKELKDADDGTGRLGDAASFTYSDRLDEFITIRLVTEKAPLILWYDRNEALEKLLKTQPASDVKRTELYYCEEGQVNINVSPNPTNRELAVMVTLTNDEVVSADLYDLTGKHCLAISAATDRGSNDGIRFNALIDHLKDGIYIVTVRTAKGKCYSRKVIKYGL